MGYLEIAWTKQINLESSITRIILIIQLRTCVDTKFCTRVSNIETACNILRSTIYTRKHKLATLSVDIPQ